MPGFDLDRTESPDTAQLSTVRSIVADAEQHDGVSPVNEEFLLRLGGGAAGSHLVLERGGAGFAMTTDGDLVVVVRPGSRGQGLGRSLASAAMSASAPATWHAWAHGDLPGARRLLTGLGFTPERVLLRMERGLDGDVARPASPTSDVVIRSFRVDEDEDALLAANRAAFADHPEQGQLDLTGLRARMAMPWFDPDGLLLAEREGRLLGFHWTKLASAETGEVYVLGVLPEAQGQGVAGLLLRAGLHHLRDAGARRVELYADEANTGAVALYERYGFGIVARHVRYVAEIGSQ